MLDAPPTPLATLQKARAIAIGNGLHHVYVGNVRDPAREATLCATCGARCVGRDRYEITGYRLDASGRCLDCGAPMAGVFAGKPGTWGSRRLPVAIERYAA
jgi:pyruvate formate lyase activating enzyme